MLKWLKTDCKEGSSRQRTCRFSTDYLVELNYTFFSPSFLLEITDGKLNWISSLVNMILPQLLDQYNISNVCKLHIYKPHGSSHPYWGKESRGKIYGYWRWNHGIEDLNSGLASFKWAVQGPHNFVVTVISLHSKESPVVGIGWLRS